MSFGMTIKTAYDNSGLSFPCQPAWITDVAIFALDAIVFPQISKLKKKVRNKSANN